VNTNNGAAVVVVPPAGAVFGPPLRWLRLEAATLLIGSLVAYSTTRQVWWLVPLTVLVPDLLMVGYLGRHCRGPPRGMRMVGARQSSVLLGAGEPDN
jgi:hypothetical protein